MTPAPAYKPYAARSGVPFAPVLDPLGIKVLSVHRSKGKNAINQSPGEYKARFKLQRIAAGLLKGELVTTRTGRERDRWVVCGCSRNMRGDVVGLFRKIDGTGARFAGLVTCGSVWTCPVCAAGVVESRRLELQLAIRKHVGEGGKVYLMTLTAPHTLEMPLDTFLKLWKKALQSFKNCKTYKRISAKYARAGSVRSLEVTYGANGWHPHTHDLIFAGAGLLDDAHALEELRQEWTRLCLKVGLGDSTKRQDMLLHGFDLRGGDYAADYVAKFGRQPSLEEWGISDELTRSHAKTGTKAGQLTPFALLIAYHQGDAKAGELFKVYAAAFEHERMLYWSTGLKAKFGIKEATDDELVRAPAPEEDRICELNIDQWRLVLSREARGELLYWAAKEGEGGVLAFLEELQERPRTHGARFDSLTARRAYV